MSEKKVLTNSAHSDKTVTDLATATAICRKAFIDTAINKFESSTTSMGSASGEPKTLRPPTNYGVLSKISRPCQHTVAKSRPSSIDATKMSKEVEVYSSMNSAFTDSSAVLTDDTEQFIIGQKVWVGGIRLGQIAYIGETHFAPGEWAGIVLEEPSGKNDGCVAGKRYFQCEPRKGIFSRLTRLSLHSLSAKDEPSSAAKMSPKRSGTVSPTTSVRSFFNRTSRSLTIGDRVIVSSGFGSRLGILRFLGETKFAPGNWCGIELDEPSGKNDGSVDGCRYFECHQNYGIFVTIAKVSLSPSSKKSRLSRAASGESLTSIGTLNSTATTNTSRFRISGQRKQVQSSSLRPVKSVVKNQSSMQDVIKEKQNHIEQLMIERDLDREDAQNQALQLQKKISEVNIRGHYNNYWYDPEKGYYVYKSPPSSNLMYRKTKVVSPPRSLSPSAKRVCFANNKKLFSVDW